MIIHRITCEEFIAVNEPRGTFVTGTYWPTQGISWCRSPTPTHGAKKTAKQRGQTMELLEFSVFGGRIEQLVWVHRILTRNLTSVRKNWTGKQSRSRNVGRWWLKSEERDKKRKKKRRSRWKVGKSKEEDQGKAWGTDRNLLHMKGEAYWSREIRAWIRLRRRIASSRLQYRVSWKNLLGRSEECKFVSQDLILIIIGRIFSYRWFK